MTCRNACEGQRWTTQRTIHLCPEPLQQAPEDRCLQKETTFIHSFIHSVPFCLMSSDAKKHIRAKDHVGVHRLYIVLFSALGPTHCAPITCDSKWVTVAFYSAFWIATEVVYVQRCLVFTYCTYCNYQAAQFGVLPRITVLYSYLRFFFYVFRKGWIRFLMLCQEESLTRSQVEVCQQCVIFEFVRSTWRICSPVLPYWPSSFNTNYWYHRLLVAGCNNVTQIGIHIFSVHNSVLKCSWTTGTGSETETKVVAMLTENVERLYPL